MWISMWMFMWMFMYLHTAPSNLQLEISCLQRRRLEDYGQELEEAMAQVLVQDQDLPARIETKLNNFANKQLRKYSNLYNSFLK